MSALGTSQEAMVLWRCSVHGMVSERSDECACARAERIEVAPVAELAAARKETERLRLTLDVERHERYAERGVAEREAVSLREALEAADRLLEAVDFGLWSHSGSIVGSLALQKERDALRDALDFVGALKRARPTHPALRGAARDQQEPER